MEKQINELINPNPSGNVSNVISKERIKEIRDEMTPEKMKQVRARIAEEDKQAYRQHQRQLNADIWGHSLFSGDQVLSFTFSQWKPDKQANKELAIDLGNTAWTLSNKFGGNNFNVLLTGGAGTGKTSLALAMAEKAWSDYGKSRLYVNTMELANWFEQRFEYPEFRQKIHDLKKVITGIKDVLGGWTRPPVDILILDDLGTEGGMRGDRTTNVRKDLQEWLYQITNSRIDLNKNQLTGSTIVTTNNTGEELYSMFNEKLISRLIPKNDQFVLNFSGLDDIRRT